jgi:hypothetical protein
MSKRILLLVFLIGVLVMMAGAAFAKKKGKGKIREMTFEGDVVETEFLRPNQGVVTVSVQKKRSLLLKPRTDFIEEIIKSAEDL